MVENNKQKKLTEMPKYQGAGLVLTVDVNAADERVYVIPRNKPNYKDESIVITICGIRGEKAKIGINASPEIYRIYRKKVLEQIENTPGALEEQLGLNGGGI